MTISTITIGAIDYTAYASVAEADAYLAVDPVRGTAWAALTDDQKGARLVAATRRLDVLNWEGDKTGGVAQVNAWPRTGATYADGTQVSTTEVPSGVENATILIAGDIALSAAAADTAEQGSNVKRAKAGSAEVEFFRPQSGKQLPNLTAFALVKEFLATGVSSLFGFSNGALSNQTSSFDDIDQFGRVEGFS